MFDTSPLVALDTWLAMVVAVRDDTAPTLNRTVMISAFCPICAEHRGPPHPVRECGPGGWYWVDVWTNPCGHVDTQDAVAAEVGLQCEYPGCTLAVFDGPDYPYCSPDCAAAGPHPDGAALRAAHRAWRHRLVGARQLMADERDRMVTATRRLTETRRTCQ